MNRMSDVETKLSPVKQALLEIRKLRAKLQEAESSMREPIAIIGMGLRFPGGANDPETFWRQLCDGVDAITEVPPDRWDVDAFYDPDPDSPGKMSTRWGGFLTDIDRFDPDFFGISPREAVSMDPQQRLLLEVAWESLEHSGISPQSLFGSSTGVFIGIGTFDYSYLHLRYGDPRSIDAYLATGGTHSVASGRLSYFLGLQGPCVSIDTACSSSLVAVHQAVQSLRLGECSLALAGGVNVILTPEFHINFSKSHVLAADGRCKAFAAAADGFVRSEGCGVIVLKRMSDAVQAGDRIMAVIKGTAINQDGRSSGLTVPNGPSQQALIRKALANAMIDPEEVDYIEAHGTGTSLGDPIEVAALSEVFSNDRSERDPLLIGSVKTNIGHLEAAAGIASIIKLALSLHHGYIPPHLHLNALNPHIPWRQIPIKVPTGGLPWPDRGRARIGSVSAFGFSGTNAHIIVQEAPQHQVPRGGDERPLHVLTLSALSETALQQQVIRLGKHLAAEPNVALGDMSYTANSGRTHFPIRLALICESIAQVRDQLKALEHAEMPAGVFTGEYFSPNQLEVVFMFTGQGAQPVGMGRQLYESQPVFRAALDTCAEYLLPYLNRPLPEVLYSEVENTALLTETAHIQPALFALEYAMTQLWRSWGIEPAAVIGHGVGEYVAACIAGVFDLQDGLRLIAERGRMMQALPANGMMASILAGERQVREAMESLATSVSIAAINSPDNIVITGDCREVRKVQARLSENGIQTLQLNVSHAFHSSLIEPMLDDFEALAKQVRFQPAEIPLVSNVTGSMFNQERDGNSAYWRRHARETVRFSDGMCTLYSRGYRLFLEIGPYPTLCGLGRQCISDSEVLWLPSLKRERGDWQQMLESLAQLYVRGMKVDWNGFDHGYARSKVSLPSYPFQRERHWLDDMQKNLQQPSRDHFTSRWEAAVAAGRRQSTQVPVDLGLHTYAAKWRSLQSITTAYILRVLRQFGVFANSGETRGTKDVVEQCGIVSIYDGLVLHWLSRLAAEGYLLRKDQQFVSVRALPEPELDSLLSNARQTHPDIGFLLDYIQCCGNMLGAILTGRESPLETLFPGGSSQTAENIYQHWALSRYFNAISAAVVNAFVRDLTPQHKVRILEIGAGTGGTTCEVLPVLPADRTIYHYTDMSDVFIQKARRKFNAYPFVRYGTLDIESHPAGQGFPEHSMDIIIAANVLHATRDLTATVQNVQSLLAPGGLLLIYEVTDPHPWFDTTVALIEGWQLVEDNLRKAGPLIDVWQWQTLLRGQGFVDVASLPQTGAATGILKAHVILARAPDACKNSAGDLHVAFSDPLEHFVSGTAKMDTLDVAERQQDAADFVGQLMEASVEERHELLVGYTRKHVEQVLNRDPSKSLNRHQRLMDLGVDSLMAVELRNRLGTGLGLKRTLPATLIFDYPSIDDVAGFLANEIAPVPAQADHRTDSPEQGSDAMHSAESRIKDLSDPEVEKLLIEKLKSMENGE